MSETVYGRKVRESDEAVLIDHEDLGFAWFPLSQVESMHFHATTGDGSMCVTEWIAKQKGLL